MKNKTIKKILEIFVVVLSFLFPILNARLVFASDVDDFVHALIFGDLSMLYFILFLGMGFLIVWKIWEFSLVMFIACIFQGIIYFNGITNPVTADQVYRPIIMFFCAGIFLLRAATGRKG